MELIYMEESLLDWRIYLTKKISQLIFLFDYLSWFSERRFINWISYASSSDKWHDHYEIL
jgi:hypothetical protein